MRNKRIFVISILIFVLIGCAVPGFYGALFKATHSSLFEFFKNLAAGVVIYPIALIIGFKVAFTAAIINLVPFFSMLYSGALNAIVGSKYRLYSWAVVSSFLVSIPTFYLHYHSVKIRPLDQYFEFVLSPILVSSLVFYFWYQRHYEHLTRRSSKDAVNGAA